MSNPELIYLLLLSTLTVAAIFWAVSLILS